MKLYDPLCSESIAKAMKFDLTGRRKEGSNRARVKPCSKRRLWLESGKECFSTSSCPSCARFLRRSSGASRPARCPQCWRCRRCLILAILRLEFSQRRRQRPWPLPEELNRALPGWAFANWSWEGQTPGCAASLPMRRRGSPFRRILFLLSLRDSLPPVPQEWVRRRVRTPRMKHDWPTVVRQKPD